MKTARERQRIAVELRERQAELSQMSSPDAVALSAEIERALAGELGTAAELIKRADVLIEVEVRAIAAEARRTAVLEELASLGCGRFADRARSSSSTINCTADSFMFAPVEILCGQSDQPGLSSTRATDGALHV